MAAAICFALCALFLLLAAHPFVTYPMSLRFLSRGRPRPAATGDGGPPAAPSFTICVCAYNEEAVIERKVRNMLDLRRRSGAVEILVYVDAAADRTASLLEPFQDDITVIVSPRRLGKTHGMNLLAERATADIIVFTDANVMIGDDSLGALADAFRDPNVGCVCGHLVYTNEAGTPTSEVGSVYWRLEERIKKLESAEGAAMGADGSLFAVRRHLHRPIPPNLIDDMFLSLSVLCEGFRVVRAEGAIAYEESVTASSEEFRRKIRIACQAFNVHRHLWPSLRRLSSRIVYMYISHKLLRWLSIYNLAIAGLLAAAGLLLLGMPLPAILVAVAAGAVLLWQGHAWHITPLAQIGEILVALLGAGIGVAESVRGKQYQTWTPAASIRQLSQD
jgi:cellulose synthase/poly-beta-1,6-N-acetylglucosamine synthase-like glycosyltransferase